MNRAEILATATDYVTRDRAETHGDVEDNFGMIARYWSVHTGMTLTSTDVSVMMALLKIARIKSNAGNADNWIDGCGYLACGGGIATAPTMSSERAE